MSGVYPLNRLVTFIEVNFSQNWYITGLPDPYDGFVSWGINDAVTDPTPSISITRSDGKVLSFEVTEGSFGIEIQTRENVIRFSSIPGQPSAGPFV